MIPSAAPVRVVAPSAALVREALVEAGEPDPGEAVSVALLTGGASRDAWIIAGGAGRYVLKRDPLEEKTPWSSRHREYLGALAAYHAQVPVARPVCYEAAGGRFVSAAIISVWSDGTASPRQILAMHDSAASRNALLQDIGRAAGRLSGVAVTAAIGEKDTNDHVSPAADAVQGLSSSDILSATLADFSQDLSRLAPDRTVMAIGLRWLMLNRPPIAAPVLVHGDFRLGNLMVGKGGLCALIDWEFCRGGDPATDLGFFCMRPWRFGHDQQRAGGLGDLGPLLDGYNATSNFAMTPARVHYAEVLGQLWWGLYCLRNSRAYRDGEHRSLQRLVLGRRIAEIEWDLLKLMDEVH